MATGQTVSIVLPGERIDTIANRLLGDPKAYEQLILDNPHLDIWDPKPGQKVVANNA